MAGDGGIYPGAGLIYLGTAEMDVQVIDPLKCGEFARLG